MAEQCCPHCQTRLPEKGEFCAACGRRISGWSGLPKSSAEPSSNGLPGGDEPTLHMEPSASLLNLAAPPMKSEKNTASPRKRWWVVAGVAGGIACLSVVLVVLTPAVPEISSDRVKSQ